MTAEAIRVLASARPANDAHYPTTLFNQGEAFAGACTSKTTIYCAAIATAAAMVSAFTRSCATSRPNVTFSSTFSPASSWRVSRRAGGT
jgi:hypothetical protein